MYAEFKEAICTSAIKVALCDAKKSHAHIRIQLPNENHESTSRLGKRVAMPGSGYGKTYKEGFGLTVHHGRTQVLQQG